MNYKLGAIALSFLASFCFFISNFLGKETLHLILGIVWFFIAIGNFLNDKKKGE